MAPPVANPLRRRSRCGRTSFAITFGIIGTAYLLLKFFNPQPPSHPPAYSSEDQKLNAVSTPTITTVSSPSPTLSDPTSVFSNESCSVENPCSSGACCGPSGYCGYGPKFCGTGCTSQCSATAECGRFAANPGQNCPLNVCCSEHGFCGTTADLCDIRTCQSNCKSPPAPQGASGHDVRSRVVGYYEIWSPHSMCTNFWSEDTAVSGLTHINVMFASIEPETYRITTMDRTTRMQLEFRIRNIKEWRKRYPDLKVYLAIGGWALSKNGTKMQPLFGEIAADPKKRKTFAGNIINFMRIYGFDGIDLDWKYPGTPARDGLSGDDFKNYPLLLKTLREAFDASQGGFGITITAPGTYQRLKGFDLGELVKYVEWINLMSYDLHEARDQPNTLQENVVRAHSNLTEIVRSCDLLWRSNVPPEKVVLGLGFYGRALTLKDEKCARPGCEISGYAKKGDCTNEAGILGYSEIQYLMNHREITLKITHDEEAAVNYFLMAGNHRGHGEDKWVSYDDEVTFQQKVDWANKLGLGGLMIWELGLDDSGRAALAGVLGHPIEKPEDRFKKHDKEAEAKNPPKKAVGTVRIDGPSSAVTSLDKKEGSHYEILGCDKVVSTEEQKVRIICMDNGPDSNCGDIYEDGVEGTIAKVPEGCGGGTYVVVHALEVSEDQSIPEEISARKKGDSVVMDMTFDYDFKRVKKTEKPVSFRIDYGSSPDYYEVVADVKT